MRSTVELTNVHDVVFVFEYGRFVVVDVEIVGSGKDCHDGGETSCLGFAVHAVSVIVVVSDGDGVDGERGLTLRPGPREHE